MRAPTDTRRRRRRFLAAALAAALSLAPTAQARPLPTAGGPAADERSIVVVEANDRFDWADAGIGAGTTAALVLLAGAATAAPRRPWRRAESK
jgi:hypothetical protein